MPRQAVSFAAWAGAVISILTIPQTARSQSAADTRLGPTAISGNPSSALHCVSRNAANVHPLGWIENGSRYAITFDADFTPITAVSRLDLASDTAAVGYGNPDLAFTASSAGTMALYVTGAGQAGCYRYKVEIEPPSAAPGGSAGTDLRPLARAAVAPFTPLQARSGPTGISGLPSSAQHCVAGNWVANVHGIGRVEQGARVTVSFDSDFDPIAGVTNIDPGAGAATYLTNDNGGGTRDPLLNFTASESGTLALFVAGVNGSVGCYRYKVEVSAPAVPAPTAVSPTSGSTAGGTAVTISGSGFASGATVTFDGTAATGVTVVSATSITATTPAHAAGAVNIVVTNSNGQRGTLTNGFTYTAPTPALYDWIGTVSSGEEVHFNVTNNQVTNWTVGVNGGTCHIGLQMSGGANIPIVNNAFTDDYQYSDLRFTWTGTFTSSTTASGTVTEQKLAGNCQGTTVSATWTATKRR